MNLSRIAACAALFSTLAAAQAFATDTPLLTPQTPIAVPGGPGGFDYMQIDAAHHRLLASHPGKATLVVLDLQTNTLQQLPTGTKVNGIAVDDADNKLFTAGGGGKVVIFDNTTLAKTGEITLTGPGDDIVLNTKTDMLYVCHDDAMEDWVFNAKDNTLAATIPIAGAPEYVVYDTGTNKVYQNIKPANLLQVIDPATNKVEASWPTAPMTSPHGMAINSKTHHIFSAGQGKVVMLDEATGKVLASADIAPGYVDQIAFDPDTQRLYCACGDAGMISVLQETASGLTLLGNVPSHKKAHTIAIDPATHAVWVSYSDPINGGYLQEFTTTK
ncbi:MAG: YncE family protein [Janthinobacterium lividum]